MARTESNMLELGTIAPSFSLPDTVSGTQKTLQELQSDKATVIMFICNHCPFVIHIQEEITKLAEDYEQQGVNFIAISSNDVDNYPDDSPENMKKFAQTNNFSFAYLYDESQEVAKAYKAACTPDFYIFDGNMKLQYRGQLDSARPGNQIPVTGKDMRIALNAILNSEKVNPIQRPSIGCNIKWKA